MALFSRQHKDGATSNSPRAKLHTRSATEMGAPYLARAFRARCGKFTNPAYNFIAPRARSGRKQDSYTRIHVGPCSEACFLRKLVFNIRLRT